ncbi:MAG: TIGR03936 family radical SAM-associated protein [Planctomycetota bacterium]
MSRVKQNIRSRFSKEGDIRFISHHDLMRTFDRALRRADLPVAMSEGHNPRPRISIPAPLSVSFRGRNEVFDVGLDEWIRPREFSRRLAAELPEGITLKSARITSTHPDRQPREFSYRVALQPGAALTEEKVGTLLQKERAVVLRERKKGSKEVNVLEFLKGLRLDGDALLMLIEFTNRGTARPEEVMQVLGCREGEDFLVGRIERTHVRMSPSA